MNSAMTGASTRKTNRYRIQVLRGTRLTAASGLFTRRSFACPLLGGCGGRRGNGQRRPSRWRSAAEVAVGLEDRVGLVCPGVEQRLDLVGLAREVREVSIGRDEVRGELCLDLVELRDRRSVGQLEASGVSEEALIRRVCREERGQVEVLASRQPARDRHHRDLLLLLLQEPNELPRACRVGGCGRDEHTLGGNETSDGRRNSLVAVSY